MKKLLYLVMIMTILSCSITKTHRSHNALDYKIIKIKKQNSWCIIYAKRNDTLFKIVSKEDLNTTVECEKMRVGKFYALNLKSRKENAPTIGNVKLEPVGYVGCYQFDSITTICLEPKKDIFDLHYTNDIRGDCYIKKSN